MSQDTKTYFHGGEDESSRLLTPDNGGQATPHGTFTPAIKTSDARPIWGSDEDLTFATSGGGDVSNGIREVDHDGISAAPMDGTSGMSTTRQLAERHGVKKRWTMYLSYYVPFFNWISQYHWRYLRGDFVAALTVASVYIPLALSLSSNVAHVPAVNGLYSFIFNPLTYAIFGSCGQLIIGPEAPGSLLVGTVVRASVDQDKTIDDNAAENAEVAGVVAGMAGAIVLIGGITRLGFLDNVLSRPFLRGFISAMGFMIFVDQLITEMGLGPQAKQARLVSHGSCADKIMFLIQNVQHSHVLTAAVAFGSFAIVMVLRTTKRHLEPRFPSVVFFPDQFLVVVGSAILTWALRWDTQGLDILGDIHGKTGNPLFSFRWPFFWGHMEHVRTAMSTSFIISLLGFFESSVAAKGIHSRATGGIQRMPFSPNRDLVALGLANIVGASFMGLPAFGGYGRSKLSGATGGRTPMVSVFLATFTAICVVWLLPYFYYIPMAVLSSVISVVSISLIEEAPHDIGFFIRIRGWSELSLMLLIFLATVFYSLYLGIALGIGLSILQIIRHSTKPRIQILGKVSGTRNCFENAELRPEKVEFIQGCLIVKIPEPLTFANTGDLKNRLRRLEFYGTTAAHPALPRVRPPEHNQNIIFDIEGVTSIDGSGAQVLGEIVKAYVDRDVRVFFCHVPEPKSDIFVLMERSGIVDNCGGMTHFVSCVEEALRLTEMQRPE